MLIFLHLRLVLLNDYALQSEGVVPDVGAARLLLCLPSGVQQQPRLICRHTWAFGVGLGTGRL